MVLVDDNHMSIENNYPFAIKIQPFEGSQMDQELLHMFEKVLKFYIWLRQIILEIIIIIPNILITITITLLSSHPHRVRWLLTII